ncbi:MAG: Flp pilus assembly complex ATPase component TadA [Candidatus Aureabacteria bacterium]|nr:Flp pilus assembly complex ATPase component TadA [Candidatus Auribacterota bacterium]
MPVNVAKVLKRSGTVVPFARERILNAIYKAAIASGERDKKTAEILADQVIDILDKCFSPEKPPTVENIQDIAEKVLIQNGLAQTAKAFILYRYERTKERLEKGKSKVIPFDKVPFYKIYYILNWAIDHNLERVEKINEYLRKGSFPELVDICEKKYDEEISAAAESILRKGDGIKVIIVAGPSSSGKTTTTIKINELLKKHGKNLVTLNIDNYFHDLELHPKDEHGDYDFETPEAIELELVNTHIHRLLEGKTIQMPIYNFKTGTRERKSVPLKLRGNEIILIDSLHGLNKKMTGSIDSRIKFNLYIETLLQMKDRNNEFIRWTDLRLLRRMSRDSKYRSYNPQQTLEHWHYVRSSELRYIIPSVNSADFIVNSAMPYEIPVMKKILLKDFHSFENRLKGNPSKEDAYLRAKKVITLLESFEEASDFSSIPPDSVIREFIGGSKYKY